MPTFDPRYYVSFLASNGAVSVGLLDAPPVLTGGFGGWEVIDRPKRTAMTRFKGRSPFSQDVGVMFDGYADDISQEVTIENLISMAQQPGEHMPPPIVRVIGPVNKPEIMWVIENISWDTEKTIWSILDNTPYRLRQACVVHLLEYVDDLVITTPTRPALRSKIIDGTGKTLKELSQQEYGSPDFWNLFTDANDGLPGDPRTILDPGTKVIVPPKPPTTPSLQSLK